jgi:hypothetical protein
MSCIVCCQNVERFDRIDSLLTSMREDSVPAVNILQSLSVARKHSPLVQGSEPRKEPWSPYLGGTGLVYKKGWPSNTTRGFRPWEGSLYVHKLPCRQLMLLKSSIDRIRCTCGNGGRYTTAHSKPLPGSIFLLRAADPSMRTILDTTICSPSRKAKPAVSLLQMHYSLSVLPSIYNGTFYCILIIFFTSNVCMA